MIAVPFLNIFCEVSMLPCKLFWHQDFHLHHSISEYNWFIGPKRKVNAYEIRKQNLLKKNYDLTQVFS